MEDSFRVRVDKTFGALSSSSLSSLWSLTDEEIEKKEWSRDLNRLNDDERIPSSFDGRRGGAGCFYSESLPQEVGPSASPSSRSNFGKELESDLENLDDDYYDDEQPLSASQKKNKKKYHDDDEDEFDVRSSIGLDSTLDYEEEEDEFDKVAVGNEKAGDRLYMRDIADYGGVIDLNTDAELPDSFSSRVPRDPRANHLAAKLRLKEDSEAAGDFHSLNLSDQTAATTTTTTLPPDDGASAPKPILKKRPSHVHPKSPKRVRFEPRFDHPVDTTHVVQSINLTPTPPPPNGDGDGDGDDNDIARPNVPDYLRNPSKYTRYTLDSSSDMDDESNRRAYMDFLNLIKKPTASDATDTVDSSRPPTFTSRKPPNLKRENGFKQNQGDGSQDKTLRIGVAAGDAQDTEVSAMEEDEPEVTIDRNVQKPGRRYRTRTVVDSEKQVT